MTSNPTPAPRDEPAKDTAAVSEGGAATKSVRRRRVISIGLAILSLTVLSYVVGAAVMFFRLPTSTFLANAFVGARAWNERRKVLANFSSHDSAPIVRDLIDKPGKTYDGFTLVVTLGLDAPSTEVVLLNMNRQVVHRWFIPFSRVWTNPPHIQAPVDDRLVCIFGTYLYPNGDLLVVFHGLQQIANGYGLAKLDKDSNVLWKYAANVHHDVDVGEDGTIYAIQHKRVAQMPTGLEFIPTPTLVDSLVLLSPEGKPLRKPIPLLEIIRDSPYAALLDSLDRSGRKDVRSNRLVGPGFDEEVLRQDVLHTNCVKVLPRRLAAKFPTFRPGQVLLSFCDLDTIAVVDLDKKAIVWAARGPWQAQHDAQFLDNGHLLLFDNRGLPKGSRVLEYDPQTQAFPWSYIGPNGRHFYSNERGMCQRLPNGNTLVVNSEGGEIQEVTHDKEVVWFCSTKRFITTARRYGPEQVPFLKGEARVRSQ